MAHFAAIDRAEQDVLLAESSRMLDEVLVTQMGLDTAIQSDAAEAADLLLRSGSAAESTPTVEDLGIERASFSQTASAGAAPASPAFHDLSAILAVVSAAYFGSDGGQVGHGASPGGADAEYSWKLNHAAASGTFTRSEVSTHRGVTVEHSVGSAFQTDACPSAGGRAGGTVTLTSVSTVTLPSGSPVRTRIDVDLAFDLEVDDRAFTRGMRVDAEAKMETGAPDTSYMVADPTDSSKAATQVAFSFGSEGVAAMSEYASSVTTSTAFDRSIEDLTAKSAIRLAAQLEEYWRSGACVEVRYDHPAAVAAGATVDLGVQPISRVDGEPIDGGTLTVESVSGAGTFDPAAGEHPNPTGFSWAAPKDRGAGTISIMSTSRRGIGTDPTTVEVMQGWQVTGTKDGAVHSGIKCDGLEGPWVVEAAGDFAFGYSARIEFTLDVSLVGPYAATMTVNGHTLHDAGEIWLEKVADDHYILHSSQYNTTLDVTPTDACAG
jgi:hypothetical protein